MSPQAEGRDPPTHRPTPKASRGAAPLSDVELGFLGIAELGPRLAARSLSPVELCQALLRRCQRLEPMLNAFITLDTERILAEARDRRARALRRPRPRPAPRRAGGRQGPLLDAGRAHDRGVQGVRGLRARRGRERRGPAQGSRRDRLRKDQHARVRLRAAERVSLRAVPEPLGPDAVHRRLQHGRGGGAGGRPGSRRARERHRRVDPRPRALVGGHWAHADVRACAAPRSRRAGDDSRSRGSDDALGARRGAPSAGYRRPRPARPDVGGRARSRLRPRDHAARAPPPGGRSPRVPLGSARACDRGRPSRRRSTSSGGSGSRSRTWRFRNGRRRPTRASSSSARKPRPSTGGSWRSVPRI